MKKYDFIIAILLCHFLSGHASIVNGFLQEKFRLQREIKNAVELLKEDNTVKATKQIERKLKQLRKKYAIVLTKYAETEQLLSAIESIDPDLYEEVSKVTNADGTLTHVYVKYVDRNSEEFTDLTENHFKAFAYTCVSQSPTDKNVCTSCFGTNTINVTIGKGVNEKLKLAHEFGHVLYMVPNLSDYFEFLNKYNKNLKKFRSGHSPFDPSYSFVASTENNFRSKLNEYLESIKNKDMDQQNTVSREKIL